MSLSTSVAEELDATSSKDPGVSIQTDPPGILKDSKKETAMRESGVLEALRNLDNTIDELDNELAGFYDDINPVLTPTFTDDVSNPKSESPNLAASQIKTLIDEKRQRIIALIEHLNSTRTRIEL